MLSRVNRLQLFIFRRINSITRSYAGTALYASSQSLNGTGKNARNTSRKQGVITLFDDNQYYRFEAMI